MIQEEEDARLRADVREPASGIQRIPYITILAGVGLSVLFLNTGILSLFFLAPLGYAVLVSGSVWLPFAAVAVANAVICVITNLTNQYYSAGIWMEIFYFTTLYLCFAWIVGKIGFFQIRAAYRFILASAAGSIAFLIFIAGNSSNSGFNIMLRNIAEIVSSIIISTAESDAVMHSTLQQMLTPERVLEVTRNVLFRGGALVSIFFLFFLNRQMSFTALGLIKKQRKDPGLSSFFAPPYTIWVLSCSLALILLSSQFKIEILEIIAWNVFVICAIIFLTQGAGILIFLLVRRSPVFRLVANVLIIIVILSPGINTLALAALILLGIIENWRPIRRTVQCDTPPG